MTCNKCGGKIGGPVTFSQGLACGMSCEYSFCFSFVPVSSESFASAWNTSKSDRLTETYPGERKFPKGKFVKL